MALVVKAPDNFSAVDYDFKYCVFLGGSIEMGKAEDWQTRITNDLNDLPVLILNPRRDDWDSSWVQDPTPGTKFHEQVRWELDGQFFADALVYYFCAGTQSPITLLELGLHIGPNRNQAIHVFCPTDFWRYGNVKVVCDEYGVLCHSNEEEFRQALRKDLI